MSGITHGRRVSLVLGAGGARGYAHLGAIDVLRERAYEIVAVTGSSIGALVGGVLAAGELEAFSEWALSLHTPDIVRLMDVSRTRSGVMRAARVLDRVRELVGDRRIEKLSIPFTAVATDLFARREVWFQRGPLDVALRASIALPGIFTPVALNGRVLVDGGLLEPLPVAPAAANPADLTVAVSLSGERDLLGPAEDATSDPGHLDEWVAHFRRGAAQAFGGIGDQEPAEEPNDSAASELPANLTGLDVVTYAYEAMQGVIDRYRLAGFPPDVLITVPKDACRTLDFHRASEMVELGRKLTAEAIDAFEAGQPPTTGPE